LSKNLANYLPPEAIEYFKKPEETQREFNYRIKEKGSAIISAISGSEFIRFDPGSQLGWISLNVSIIFFKIEKKSD